MVPPNLNKLPVVGQTPHRAAGSEPQQTPTPLHTQDKQVPLQIYETDRPFFGSAPVGGLDILTSKSSGFPPPCCRMLWPARLCDLSLAGLQGNALWQSICHTYYATQGCKTTGRPAV